MNRKAGHFYDFGPFRLDTIEKFLLRGNEVVPLTPKLFEILLVLAQTAAGCRTKKI